MFLPWHKGSVCCPIAAVVVELASFSSVPAWRDSFRGLVSDLWTSVCVGTSALLARWFCFAFAAVDAVVFSVPLIALLVYAFGCA